MLDVITSVTESPTKAQAYCVDRFPKLKNIPPAIASKHMANCPASFILNVMMDEAK